MARRSSRPRWLGTSNASARHRAGRRARLCRALAPVRELDKLRSIGIQTRLVPPGQSQASTADAEAPERGSCVPRCRRAPCARQLRDPASRWSTSAGVVLSIGDVAHRNRSTHELRTSTPSLRRAPGRQIRGCCRVSLQDRQLGSFAHQKPLRRLSSGRERGNSRPRMRSTEGVALPQEPQIPASKQQRRQHTVRSGLGASWTLLLIGTFGKP